VGQAKTVDGCGLWQIGRVSPASVCAALRCFPKAHTIRVTGEVPLAAKQREVRGRWGGMLGAWMSRELVSTVDSR
jgi:hypothetical protein